MTGQELTSMQKAGRVIIFAIGSPFIIIGMILALYVAMFRGIVKLISNRGKVRQAAPRPVKEEIAEPMMEPILEPAMTVRIAR